MRFIYFLLFIALIGCQGNIDTNTSVTTESSEPTTEVDGYDSLLAKEYGADKYGMKPYILALLKTGPNQPKDSVHAAELQKAHMDNIDRLAKEGKLVLAGPFYGEAKHKLRGLYIFNTSSLDSASAYVKTDPAIKYGSLVMRIVNWYGSAALIGVNDVHDKIAKEDP